ncbi:MAG: CTP-dependent riboflavin kinase [Candidatus Lokiarchaeota archaeon]
MSDKQKINPNNYSNWFALYTLCEYSNECKAINISSVEFGKLLDLSQQTASRRLNDLEELGWIERKIEGKSQIITITENGINLLFNIYENIKGILENLMIVGEVTEGMHEGGYYVSIKGYYDQFKDKLGFEPYKGTLNLKLSDTDLSILKEQMNHIKPIIIEGFKDQNREYGPVSCYDVYISLLENREKKRKAAILNIKRTHHKENIIEILAKPYLREYFNLKNGDKLVIKLNHNH